ncbi:helix-turn-helix domain-containing protein [Streptomyces ziwulingensis]
MSGPRTELARLAEELVELRRLTGLSLGALAGRTSASKSAWHRYLAGHNLPPCETVVELCDLAGVPPARLMALWEVAETECSGREKRGASPGRGADVPETHRAAERAADEDADRAPAPAVTRTAGTRRASEAPEPAGPTTVTGPRPGEGPGRPRSWRRLARRWWPVGASVLLSAAVLAAVPLLREPAEPAPAPPGCRGTACDGEDSESQGCTEPGASFGAVAQARFPGGARMEIRHSEHCDALWARVWLGQVGDRIELRVPGRPTRHAVIRDRHDAEGYVYTRMTGGDPSKAQACLLPAEGGPEQCFRA